MTSQVEKVLVAASLLLGGLLRFVVVFYGPPLSLQNWSDMQGYLSVADAILAGIWKETHFFQSIGYPLLISFFKKYFFYWGYTLASFQALLSTATLFFLFLIARRCFGPKVGLISLTIATLHLPWILFVGLALPETVYTFLLAVSAWLSLRLTYSVKPAMLNAILWGATFILGFWLKGTHVFWMPLFMLGLLLLRKSKALMSIAVISLVVMSGLMAHGMFAASNIGKFQLSASTGGLNFIEGKCPHKNNRDPIGYSWQSPLYYQLDLHEQKTWDRPFTDSGYYLKQGLGCIQQNPFVLIQSLESIPFLFMGNTLWPVNHMPAAAYSRLYELYFSIFLMVGFILALKGMSRQEVLVWLLPLMALFLCVYIFKSELRYRLPFDVWLIPLAVKGWFNFLKLKSSDAVS